MYSESDLESAVAAGVLSGDSAAAFRAHVAANRETTVVDEEHFRLLTGFNDIFVAIALLLVFVPLGMGMSGGDTPVGSIVTIALSWGLAEFFTRRRRMALPSILLLLTFVGGCFGLARSLLAGLPAGTGLALAGLLAAGATWLHWRRFRVPITIAAGTAVAIGGAFAGLMAALPSDALPGLGLLMVFGIGTFALAMWWDGSDRERQTRRSDVAFWLHLLAAPLIAHPIFGLLGVFDGGMDSAKTGMIFALYGLFAVVSIAVDRRALLVSGLAYFLYAVASLFGSRAENGIVPTAVIVGAMLLLLSAFWTATRSALVIYLPEPIRRRLPPIRRG